MPSDPFSIADLLDTDIVTENGETLGTLDDVIVDQESGKISYFILSSNHYLGHERELYAIHYSFFVIDKEEDNVVFSVKHGHQPEELPTLTQYYEEEEEVLPFGTFLARLDQMLDNPHHRTDHE